tara:strand:+ start:151 stop:828 length:678 start_codon:yes stop_codon:yes gene_type:complete
LSDKNLDIEKVLDILGNETRRRILRYLAEEPRYFIQLSKELGVSQQAVLKHLEILQALNLVESFAEKSDLAGPDRKYYRLNRSLILTIGLSEDVFRMKMREYDNTEEAMTNLTGFEEAWQKILDTEEITEVILKSKKLINKIDENIIRIDEKRSDVVRLRQDVTNLVHEKIRSKFNSKLERRIIYSLIESPEKLDIENLAEEFDVREKEIIQSIEEIQKKLKIII